MQIKTDVVIKVYYYFINWTCIIEAVNNESLGVKRSTCG